MELLISLIPSIVWGFICYFQAKRYKELKPEFNIEPSMYGLGGFLFGLFSLLWLVFKFHNCNKN